MDATSPERLAADQISVPASYLGGAPSKTDGAGHFEAGVALGIVPVSISYAAVRDLRAATAGPQAWAM